jgi:hypothetical protein
LRARNSDSSDFEDLAFFNLEEEFEFENLLLESD